MTRRCSVLAAILAVSVVQACDSPTNFELPMLLTESASYDFIADGEGLRADITYTFTNRTKGTVYHLVHCGGGSAVTLEQYVEGVWTPAWGTFLNSCLTSPVVIERGATFIDTLNVWGALPGGRFHPQFSSDDPSGTYRLVWHEVLSSLQSDDFPLGPEIPLEARTSNSFELVLK